MRIGFDHYTIDHLGIDPRTTLSFACDHGLEGVQFLEPSRIDPELDPGRLADFRRCADEMGMYLEVGLPSPNPVRRSFKEDRQVGVEEQARYIARHAKAAADLGCRHARAYVGDRHDRFRTEVPWIAQLDATRAVLEFAAPILRDLGVKVALETHADLTVAELLRFLEALGSEVVGVTVDTGNLVMRLDEPVAAVERLAPWVLSTHVKDAVLERTPRGLAWQARPVGSGILPMPDLIAPLIRANPDVALSIELHPRTYDLPIADERWLAYFPELRTESLAAVVALADQCERRYQEGSLARPADVEAVPWEERALDWLARSLGYLRAVVPSLARLGDAARPAAH